MIRSVDNYFLRKLREEVRQGDEFDPQWEVESLRDAYWRVIWNTPDVSENERDDAVRVLSRFGAR